MASTSIHADPPFKADLQSFVASSKSWHMIYPENRRDGGASKGIRFRRRFGHCSVYSRYANPSKFDQYWKHPNCFVQLLVHVGMELTPGYPSCSACLERGG